ncbi:MAG: hypothetical protein K5894_07450 [Lachnospiraceae bacterium]|nr:hypothetical protein [Lachnospiraceae bacterium]
MDAELKNKLDNLTPEEKEQLTDALSSNFAEYGKGNTYKSDYKVVESQKLQIEYNSSDGFFYYLYPNGDGFRMNVPMGSIVNGKVEISMVGNAFISRYTQDGINVEVEGVNTYTSGIKQLNAATAANYNFYLESGRQTGDGPLVKARYKNRLSFLLADNTLPLHLSVLRAPYGYRIGRVTLNGNDLELTAYDNLELKDDGLYSATFVGAGSVQLPDYTVQFDRDTSAPYMIFSEDISQEIEDTVYFYPSESDAQVTVFINGHEISDKVDGASAGGNYTVVVSDRYDNTNKYDFTIKEKRTTSWPLYLFLILIALLTGIIIAGVSRRKLRVR